MDEMLAFANSDATARDLFGLWSNLDASAPLPTTGHALKWAELGWDEGKSRLCMPCGGPISL
jgi:hypothetical protein